MVGPAVPERRSRRPTAHEWAWIAAVPVGVGAFAIGAASAPPSLMLPVLGHVLPASAPGACMVGVGACATPLGCALLTLHALLRQLEERSALWTLPSFLAVLVSAMLQPVAHVEPGLWLALAVAFLGLAEARSRRSRPAAATAACLLAIAAGALAVWACLLAAGSC